MNKDKKGSGTSSSSFSLNKMVTGTGFIFIGTLLSMFLVLISKVIIARYWSEDQYGIFALVISISNILLIISTFGFKQGLARSIAFSHGKKEYKKIRVYIKTSLFLSLFISILISIIIFVLSDLIAINVFHNMSYSNPLKIISFSIPFLTVIQIIVSIYRGFSQVKQTVYFDYILKNMFFPIFLIIIVVLGLSFINVFYSYIFSIIITCIILIYYAARKVSSLNFLFNKSIDKTVAKELIFFSLPLLGTAVLNTVISSTDVIMIGAFLSSANVAFYNVAINISSFISFALSALLVIYIPVITGLFAKKNFDELKRNFSIITKWISSISFPLFLLVFLFPAESINILFGPDYIFGSDALRILSLGFMINNLVGPCGATLISVGKSRFVMFTTLATAIINVVFNALLIPVYGIVGAAAVSGFSLVSINLLKSYKLYTLVGANPFSKNLVKPIITTLIVGICIFYIFENFFVITNLTFVFLFILFYVIYLFIYLFTRSLDVEDLELLKLIEFKKDGIVSKTRNYLARFL